MNFFHLPSPYPDSETVRHLPCIASPLQSGIFQAAYSRRTNVLDCKDSVGAWQNQAELWDIPVPGGRLRRSLATRS